MNKLFHTATLLFLPVLASAQVSTYEFSESVGTYTPITAADGGVALGVPTYWPHVNNNRAWVNNPFNDPDGQVTQSGYLNPANGPGYPIGFDFEFNGDVFDVIGISNGGWISFGKSSDGLQAVWVYNWNGTPAGDPFRQWAAENAEPGPNPTYRRNRVAGFGNSGLQQVDWSSLAPPGQVSKLRMATIGTAPNRVCVVQWEDYGLHGDITVAMNKINFQIRLNEADNSVEVVFGPQNWVSSLGRYKRTQCGLSGRSNLDFNGRMTVYEQPAFLYDWNATVAADTNAAICQFEPPQIGQPNNSGVPPVLGLTWRWDPPVCPPPAWPFNMDQITFDAARINWQPSSAGEYEYFVSTENSTSGPEVSSGTTTDTEASLFGLDPSTVYYVFVRSICGGEPGVWSMSVSFTTLGGGVVVCDGGVVTEDYCSYQFSTKEWLYVSADGSPLKLEFEGGFLQGLGGESFKLWDGTAPIGNGTSFSGDLTGNFFNAVNGAIFIRLVTVAGACHAQDWYLPLQWRIGCKNCTDPLVNYTLGDVDCDNQEFYVDVNVFNLGSSATLELENDAGVASTTVSTTGVHAVGPFPAGTPVVIRAQNPDNAMCYSLAAPLVNEPCAIVGCDLATYEQCSAPNDVRHWLVQGDGAPISVRFLPGYSGWDATVKVYDGSDEMAPSTTVSNSGYLDNQVVTSTNPANQLLIYYAASTYPDYACSEGNTLPMKFITECVDACTPPAATFTANCISTTQFEVLVNITSMGSAATLSITNDQGATTITASDTGTYTAGPFPSLATVQLEVEGANTICTLTRPGLVRDCSTWTEPDGISELASSPLRLFPNPSNGTVRVELPGAGKEPLHLRVLDLTGRVVAQQLIDAQGTTLHLEQLPSGLYTVAAYGTSVRFTAPLSIQH